MSERFNELVSKTSMAVRSSEVRILLPPPCAGRPLYFPTLIFNIMNKTKVLVTGANSGFGKLIALTFARAGYQVYATARDLKSSGVADINLIAKKEQLSINWLKLDVTNQEQIDDAAKIIEKDGGLDILVNNAGFGILGPIQQYANEDVARQFETNFFGVTRMIYAFLPILKKSSCPKIITISSIAGIIVAPSYGIYGSSKHAVEVFIETLRYELFNTKIKVSLVEPAGFDTNFSHNSHGLNLEKETNQSTEKWYKNAVNFRNKRVGSENNILSKNRDPQRVANLILKIAKTKNPKLRYLIGEGAHIEHFLRKILPDFIWEKIMILILKYLSSK